MSCDVYKQGSPFSLTITTSERYPWFRLHPKLTETLTQLLSKMSKERETALFAWCIMPDHLHLLLQDSDIMDFIRLLKGRITPEGRRIEPGRTLWQRSFYDHALRKEESLADVALYIWYNPVRAGIIDCAWNYPWSGSLVWPDWKQLFHTPAGGD
jgi:putative transposase